jgi:hypothetical protein
MLNRNTAWTGCAVVVFAAAAALGQTEVYRLNPGSFYEDGCHGACQCPILFREPLTGTFRLTTQSPDPLFQHYAVTDVNWQGAERDLSGSGTYRVGGEVALQQEMTLDVDIAGTTKHVDSGLVTVQAAWPNIVITVSNMAQTPLCYDTVIHIDASVLPSHCSADFNNDGDTGTDADIEAYFACLAGNCCDTCGSADFNGDGDVGTDADIESFFRVLAGGSC